MNTTPSSKKSGKLKLKKSASPKYETAFLVFDLAEKSIKGKIIRITELLRSKDGETELNEYLFSNEGVAISAEAFAHHNISEENLAGKPNLNSYDFNKARNIVVWDGHTTTSILKANSTRKTAPIINLLSLARFKEAVPKSISLNKYAAIAQPDKKNLLDFRLRKPENKVFCLPSIYDFLRKEYLEQHGMNNPAFLCAAGRARDKNSYLSAIKKAMVKHQEYLAKKGKPQEPAPVATIAVALGENHAKQGVTAVTVLKRKKS